MKDFVHLHVHSEYSLLDGACRIKQLIKRVKELNMKSIAITDHGVMYGVIDFYKECINSGVKPIIGCEVYTAKRNMTDKEPNVDSSNGHLILLAMNNTGYHNLMKIVSLGFTEGFYYKPRIDYNILEKYSEGLIALSACLAGDISSAILNHEYDKAKRIITKLSNIFGEDHFYLEMQENGLKIQNIVNEKLIEFSEELNVPLVATNDVHYLRKEDADAQEILMCIQTGKTIEDEDRMQMNTDQLYLKDIDEMYSQFHYSEEAVANTLKIADKCNITMDFDSLHLPEFQVPDNMDSYDYLRELCIQGFKERYGENEEVLERLEFELNVIKDMNYVDYFLIVYDFIKYAKDNQIIVGPGRGSAAGSVVSFCLYITNVDPIKYNLIFERFLNPERISMPDIDIDFCYERRSEVIDYVIRKYGEEKVTQIITFGTMAARAVIRDVGRALAYPYGEVDKIAKMIPTQLGITIEKALDINSDLEDEYNNNFRCKKLIDMSILLEGMPRHASTHAAGVVIAKKPVTEYVPLQKNDDCITTQFPMTTLEDIGLLKMDFLGLRTLTVIRDTIDFVEFTKNKKIEIDNIEYNEKNVYKMISDGSTSGVFQLESAGMTQFMKELQPDSLEDIIAGISLYRPGPMDQIPIYVQRKKNPNLVSYDHPLLENILEVTYGCMVYQEQVMQIVRDLAGYSYGRSDLVRRAMSKKKTKVMMEERKNFIYGLKDDDGNIIVAGALSNGVSEEISNKLFDSMMDFASYAFNKSHAAAYAVIAYQTAFLKHYYPIEFMAAILNSFINSSTRISKYVHDCEKMKIKVLAPDINMSMTRFSVKDNKIHFGLAAIKNVGKSAALSIIKEREGNGKYIDFVDFCERTEGLQVNKRCIESLIKCGSFDRMEIKRSQLMAMYEKILDGIHSRKNSSIDGQISLFDTGKSQIDKIKFPEINEYDTSKMLTMEKEMLGLYITGHPLSKFDEIIKMNANISSIEINEFLDNQSNSPVKDEMFVRTAGILSSIKSITTKKNKLMAFINIEDLYGQMEVIIFPTIFDRYRELLKEENMIWIEGKLSVKEDEEPKILADKLSILSEGDNFKNQSKKIDKIKVLMNKNLNVDKEPLYAMIQYFEGQIPIYIYEKDSKTYTKKMHVTNSEVFLEELVNRVGKDNIKVSNLNA